MLAFIDCYINEPVNHSINEYLLNNPIPYTYHCPAKFGLKSLLSLPSNPSKIILLGSASNVTANERWHLELLEYLIPILESGTPLLGICFGHQLLASHYGSRINYISQDQINLKELRKVKIIRSFFNYSRSETLNLAYAHQQVICELGPELEVLGASKISPYEIIKHKKYPFWGTQSHPEASVQFLAEDANIKGDLRLIQTTGHRFISEFLNHC